jgi:hypothetical protein
MTRRLLALQISADLENKLAFGASGMLLTLSYNATH